MPLSMLPLGESACIRRISGPPPVRARLAELGFVVGERVTVVATLGGSLIVQVKGSRVAVGHDMARRMMV